MVFCLDKELKMKVRLNFKGSIDNFYYNVSSKNCIDFIFGKNMEILM